MTNPPDELPLPRALVFVIAITCGVMAAIVVQALLAHRGIELGAVARDFASVRPQLRSAAAWWISAGTAFAVGAVVAGVNRAALPWSRLRPLRWIAAAVIVFALAHVGHSAGAKAGGGVDIHVAAHVAALCTAALMALVGAHFALGNARSRSKGDT